MEIHYIEYQGDNIELLNRIENEISFTSSGYKIEGKRHITPEDYLYRTSELSELPRTLRYGTDRGGYPPKLWDDDVTPFDDIIFGTTGQMIRDAEKDENKSSSFKKIPIISRTDRPIIIIYDVNEFELVGDRQWKFKNWPGTVKICKYKNIKHIIII